MFTGEYAVALRKTAPANSPSYSATTRRSPGRSSSLSMAVATSFSGSSAAHDAERVPELGHAALHRREWLRAWPPGTDSSEDLPVNEGATPSGPPVGVAEADYAQSPRVVPGVP